MFVFDREVELTAMNFTDWTGSAGYPSGSGWGDNVRFHVDDQCVMNCGGIGDKPGLSMLGTMFVLTAENDETLVRIQGLDIRVLDVPEPGSWSLARGRTGGTVRDASAPAPEPDPNPATVRHRPAATG